MRSWRQQGYIHALFLCPRVITLKIKLQHIREEVEKLNLGAKWTMTAEAREYHETLAIEKAIKDNPAIRQTWVNRQLELEAVRSSVAEVLDSIADE